MTARKPKMTGFARFLLFLLIAGPLIFFGVSYYKGEDGVQTLKEFVGLTSQAPKAERNGGSQESGATSEVLVNTKVKQLSDELADTKKRLEEALLANEKLREQVEKSEEQMKKKDEEVAAIQAQLDKIKSAIGQ
ncbi:MAG: hypothetical protein AAFV95_01120 [Bacteroidota bacterium]